jgi:putative DNA primase/helicase
VSGSKSERVALLDAARAYGQRGWLVMPVHSVQGGKCTCPDGPTCASPGKHPRTQHGLKEATSDLATIERWWKRWPDANVAIVTGAGSGLVVLDVDSYNEGDDTLAELVAEHGELPPTTRVITGGDGLHVFFAHPGEEVRNTAGKKLGQGLDVRGDGGYVVAAPSLHLSGNRYQWVDVDVPPAPMPAWMLEKLRKPVPVAPPAAAPRPRRRSDGGGTPYGLQALAGEVSTVRATGQGGRNAQLNISALKLGGYVAGGELEEAFVRAELTAAALDAGLGVTETKNTIKSGLGKGMETPKSAPERPTGPAAPRREWEPPPADDDAPPADDAEAIPVESPEGAGGCRHTDLGNAQRLLAMHGGSLRYVAPWATWLEWDGRRWRLDVKGNVMERAKTVPLALWAEAASETDPDRRKQLGRWAAQSEGVGRIEAIVKLARTSPAVAVEPDQLDANPWLFNVANGTIDLRTGALLPHRPTDLITKLATVAFDPAERCPTWAAFLQRIIPDASVRDFLQEAIGYALTGVTTEQVMFFLFGLGANGKSTLTDTLQALFGEYGRQAEPGLLLARQDVHPTGVADLQGARLVVATETEEGRRLAEATVKQLTGGDRIKARKMRQDFFEFTPSHKLFLHGNHRPVVRGTDHAIWRRIRLIPFEVTIPEDQRDRRLTDKLVAEAPGILAWAVRGCLEWQRRGLSQPAAVLAATSEYRTEMDVLGAFLEESCVLGEHALVSAASLYRAYQVWLDDNGERSVSQRSLGAALTERGFDRRKHGADRRWYWFGLGLGEPMNPSDPQNGISGRAGVRERGSGFKGPKGSWVQEEVPLSFGAGAR